MNDENLARGNPFATPSDQEPPAPQVAAPTDLDAPQAAGEILATIVKAKGGSHREGQAQMARFVAMALDSKRPLLIEGGTGVGKALDITTPIPTPRGFVPIGDLKVGDEVFNEIGQVVTVTHAFNVLHDRPCYEITFSGGATLVADAEHQWDVVDRAAFLGLDDQWDRAKTLTTEQIAAAITDSSTRFTIPTTAPLAHTPTTDLPVDPYAVGMWVARFSERTPGAIWTQPEAIEDVPAGFTADTRPGGRTRITPDADMLAHLEALGVTTPGRGLPTSYLFAGRNDRQALLEGMLDSTAAVSGGSQVQFATSYEQVAHDLLALAASLGFRPYLSSRTNASGSPRWVVMFSPSVPVFRNHVKQGRFNTERRTRNRGLTMTAVTPVATRPVRCISVTGERHLYLAGEAMIPTHNSIGYLSGIVASGRQTVVAPHTKALQDQLRADLDLLISAFPADDPSPLDAPPRYAVIKGRQSYLCLAKTREEDPGRIEGMDDALGQEGYEPTSDLGKEVAALAKWGEDTDTGDRSDVPFPVSGKAWSMVSTSSEDCAGKQCPFYEDCFAETARRQAQGANVIVTNQAFLAMAMKMPNLLPESVDGIVVDEAHEFPAVVAGTFGAEVTAERIRNAAKKLRPALAERDKGRSEIIMENLAEAADALDEVMPPPKNPDRDLIGQPAVTEAFDKALGVLAKARTMVSALPQGDEAEKARRDILLRMVDNLAEDIRLLRKGSDDTQVAWVERQRGKAVARSARFDVAATISDNLIQRWPGSVFTSATLTVNQRFDAAATRLGMHEAQAAAVDAGRVEEDQQFWGKMTVPSPFDYSTQSLLYLPPDMPNPSMREGNGEAYYQAVADVAAKVARAAGGRTLVLCTSRSSVQTITEALKGRLGEEFPILSQEPGEPTREVARAFAEDPRSILVGTRTFWSGVSVDGDTCAAVVLDKLPFPPPSDPIIAARTEKADREARGKGFAEVTLAEACLTVVQGAGRLIRTVRDRGVVVICDPRLAPGGRHSKSYGRKVLGSLPPFRRATSEKEVLDFLADIDATADDAVPHEVEVEEAPKEEA